MAVVCNTNVATAIARVASVAGELGPGGVKCKVPRTKGTKLPAAERAVRQAHCKVGKVKRVTSKGGSQGAGDEHDPARRPHPPGRHQN